MGARLGSWLGLGHGSNGAIQTFGNPTTEDGPPTHRGGGGSNSRVPARSRPFLGGEGRGAARETYIYIYIYIMILYITIYIYIYIWFATSGPRLPRVPQKGRGHHRRSSGGGPRRHSPYAVIFGVICWSKFVGVLMAH